MFGIRLSKVKSYLGKIFLQRTFFIFTFEMKKIFKNENLRVLEKENFSLYKKDNPTKQSLNFYPPLKF